MRELIDVTFQDQTSYPSLVSGDIGAAVIDHVWGAENLRQTLTFAQFLEQYPAVKGKVLSQSYLNVYCAFLAGLSQIEVVRLRTNQTYQQVILGATAGAATAISEIPESGTNTITLKNTGKLPEMYIPGAIGFKIVISSSAVGATVAGSFDVTVTLLYTDADATVIEIESFTGGSVPGVLVDGQNWFIGAMLEESNYMTLGGAIVSSGLTGIAASQTAREYTLASTEPTALAASDLTAAYDDYFTDIENSAASILIDPGTTLKAEADEISAAAKFRTDAVALIGYPVASTFDKASISAYKDTLNPDKFSGFYAARELFVLNDMTYTLNGIGRIAGRMASVANEASVNQLPSARTYGSFGGQLAKTLKFADVLELHDAGVNSVYSTTTGARIFGLRSMHTRATSYYSKLNVSRVVARILKFAFGVAMDAIHTGNTEAKRLLVYNLLNTDLTRLKPDSLRAQSKVICDSTNNTDLRSNGGEILIVDYELYFVKLIERVSFTITATDSSVSVQLN